MDNNGIENDMHWSGQECNFDIQPELEKPVSHHQNETEKILKIYYNLDLV